MFIFAVGVLLLFAAYVYYFILRSARFWLPKVRKGAAALLAALVLACLIAITVLAVQWLLIVLFYVMLASIVIDAVGLPLKRILPEKPTGKWECIRKSGLLPVTAAVLFMVFGYFNIYNVHVTEYRLETAKHIRPQGYRVALISDLHFGLTFDDAKLREYCADISAREPDVVILCGDIVDERTTAEEMRAAFEALGEIKSACGIFYVIGNHDVLNYARAPAFTEMELMRTIEENGIVVLRDSLYAVNDELTLIGRDDISENRSRKATAEILGGEERAKYLLLLDHQPLGFAENAAAGADLQLSGHTHNGQIWPLAHFYEPLGTADLAYGHVKLNDFQAIVSSGIAGWGYPFRTQGISEYVIIDIHKAE